MLWVKNVKSYRKRYFKGHNMGTLICYFTGTGNSLAIARDLAGFLPADLKAMQSVVQGDKLQMEKYDSLGLVFPVYNHRIPYIVKRFVDMLREVHVEYIFAVCTYGGSPCISLEYLSRMLSAAGQHLSCGFGVKMPYNYVSPSQGITGLFRPFVLGEVPEAEQNRIFADARQTVKRIYEAVLSKSEGPIEVEHQKMEHLVDFLNLRETLQKSVWLKIGGFKGKTKLSCLESIQLMDYGFHCNDQCIRCGTCVRICPVANIKMTADGPRWQHHCEQCFACLHWCPKSAIQFGKGTAGRKRYHHPGISLSDMLKNGFPTRKEEAGT
jgi:ferredoxin